MKDNKRPPTRYKLARKLRKCPLPVGSVSGEMMYFGGKQIYRFTHTVASRSSIPDVRAWDVPAWMCASMPYYFHKAKKEDVSK